MVPEIYYFSGTGNSLVVARDIAEKTNANLIPIYSTVDKESIKTDSDIIGIVFPTYYEPYGGVPLIVRRFVRKLEDINSKYIFAICTYGSGSFTALKCLEKILVRQGGKLAAGFTINMPNNMAGSSLNNPENQEKMFQVWEDNIEFISTQIKTRKEIRFNTPNIIAGKIYVLIRLIVSPIISIFKPLTLSHLKRYSDPNSGLYEEMLPYMDRSFYNNDQCIVCGNCMNICPVGNIKIIDERPEWQHHCEFCLACFHWCPKEAIESSELKATVKYHHPDIKFSDMILRKDK